MDSILTFWSDTAQQVLPMAGPSLPMQTKAEHRVQDVQRFDEVKIVGIFTAVDVDGGVIWWNEMYLKPVLDNDAWSDPTINLGLINDCHIGSFYGTAARSMACTQDFDWIVRRFGPFFLLPSFQQVMVFMMTSQPTSFKRFKSPHARSGSWQVAATTTTSPETFQVLSLILLVSVTLVPSLVSTFPVVFQVFLLKQVWWHVQIIGSCNLLPPASRSGDTTGPGTGRCCKPTKMQVLRVLQILAPSNALFFNPIDLILCRKRPQLRDDSSSRLRVFPSSWVPISHLSGLIQQQQQQ